MEACEEGTAVSKGALSIATGIAYVLFAISLFSLFGQFFAQEHHLPDGTRAWIVPGIGAKIGHATLSAGLLALAIGLNRLAKRKAQLPPAAKDKP